MKRILRFLVSFLLVFIIVTPITSFAVETASSGEGISYNTIFTRMWEYAQNNTSEVVSAGGSLLLLFFGWVSRSASAKQNKKLINHLNSIKGDTQGTVNSQNSVLDIVNQMIGGYNGMKAGYDDMRIAYELNATKEDDRNRLIGAVMVQNTAILEMLSSVYVHNKNLPQGVKDLIILKYANAMKALSDDEILCAVVESVREKINFEEPACIEEETAVEEYTIDENTEEFIAAEE
jgi:hypothetical protein